MSDTPTPKWKLWTVIGLGVAVVVGAVSLPSLRRRVERQGQAKPPSEEQARRELVEKPPMNPSDPRVKAKIFWASNEDGADLSGYTIELPLSNNPALRAKQVLNTLLAGPVDTELRTLPPDAALLAFYILPDGTAIADFSEALATSTPSGVQSEQLAVDSIARTLEANVPQVRRLKILIHGQEVDTLAGHLDLTGMFPVNAKAIPMPARVSATDISAPTQAPIAATSQTAAAATTAPASSQGKSTAAGITASKKP